MSPSRFEASTTTAFTLSVTTYVDPADSLRRRLEGATRLVEMTRRLAAEHDLQRILEIVATECCPALEAERSSLFLYDEARGEVYTRVASGLAVEEIRHSVEHGIVGWVVRHRQSATVQDVFSDPRWNPAPDQQTGFSTHNILAVPVLSPGDDRILGVLEVWNKRTLFDAHDEHLLQAFAAHIGAALDRQALRSQIRVSREIEQSLEAARNVQLTFLPHRLPDIPGYALAAWWQPAEAVGGDYYDVVPLPDGCWALAVADVSGHGLAPSLIMAAARAMLHVLSQTSSRPARIVNLLSRTIDPDLETGRFITMFLGSFDPRRHEVRFANAGHAPAYHFRKATQEFIALKATGLPIGVAAARCKESQVAVQLEPGDLLVLATDGTIEQRGKSQELFGSRRLCDLIAARQNLSAEELVQEIRTAITSRYDGLYPDDDVTVLVLKRDFVPDRNPAEAVSYADSPPPT
jgi:sigma-B regulation protein RsbU (phosphoserine phosphatase)